MLARNFIRWRKLITEFYKLLKLFFSPCTQYNLCTFFGKQQSNCFTNSTARTCYYYNFYLLFHLSFLSIFKSASKIVSKAFYTT